jgi:hypothetical protein
MILVATPSALAANPQKDAVKALIKAIKRGEDLRVAYAGAISDREVASLSRVTKCDALNLMKQPGGEFTGVWDCGSKGALGMEVRLVADKITSISTMEVGMRPNRSDR